VSFNSFLQSYPSTNARLFVSAVLCVFYVVVVLVGMILGKSIDGNVIWSIGTFLLVLSGLDAAQFTVKRKTTLVTPPTTTAENANDSTQ
jgi:hypothetical protein